MCRAPITHMAALPQASPDAAVFSASSAALEQATASPISASAVFEPHMDPAVLAAQLAVLLVSAMAAMYWWLVVVPSERAALARSKRRGGVGEYLSDLEQATDTGQRSLERWFYTDWLRKRVQKRAAISPWAAANATTAGSVEAVAHGAKPDIGATAASKQAAEAGVGCDPATEPERNLLRPTYETPTPAFLSLDNPIIAAAALIGAAAGVSALLNAMRGG